MDAPISPSRFRLGCKLACCCLPSKWRRAAGCPLLPGIALLLALLSPATSSAGQSFSVKPPPAWVQQVSSPDFSTGQSKGGITYLLADYQSKVSKATVEKYYHQVKRVDSASGLEDISQLEFDFEPSYQTLIIHYIRILRGGQTIDALRSGEISVIQQESELSQRLYNGTLTALALLSDVRVGDVIDYAYSINGNNPVMGGHYADSFYIEIDRPVERVRLRLLWPANRRLYYRTENTTVEPVIRQIAGDREYVWNREKAAPVEENNDAPQWLNQIPTLYLSDFADWKAVVEWALPLYKLSQPLDAQLAKQIEDWRKHSDSPERKLIAALRFVQDDIRYLGIEIGPNSHSPTQPSIVFKRRFGDCKDKSLLFVAILNQLGIEAYTALVNSETGQLLDHALPSPYAFDHVIVQVKLDGRTYWIDPTIRFQRGALRYRYNPDYRRALVVREGNTQLEEIPFSTGDEPTVIAREAYTVYEDESATLEAVTTYRADDADGIRYRLAEQTLSEYGKNCVEYYSETFPSIKAEGLPTVSDDEETNTIVIVESYRIPAFWKDGRQELFAGHIYENLSKPAKPQSLTPSSISFPVHVQHIIELNLPEPLLFQDSSKSESNDVISFRYSRHFDGKNIKFDYRIQTLRDHVAAESLADYVKSVEKIEQTLGFTVQKDALGAVNMARGVIAFLVIMTIAGIAIFGIMRSRLYKNNRRFGPTEPAPGAKPETAISLDAEPTISKQIE
jgi:transglutaminase-like putative cysteine protease